MKKTNIEKETVHVSMTWPMERGRGGLRDYSEAKAETVQRVRGEFLSDTFKPKITIDRKSVTFNMACVALYPNSRHVLIGIDESNRCLIVEPTTENDKNGLQFANVKNGRNVPRTCTARNLCAVLFDFMKWNPDAKYRILATVREFDGRKIMVFHLDESLQVFPEDAEACVEKKIKTAK